MSRYKFHVGAACLYNPIAVCVDQSKLIWNYVDYAISTIIYLYNGGADVCRRQRSSLKI